MSTRPSQDNRLAANRHSNTVPDVTAVTIMLARLPKALKHMCVRRFAAGFGLLLAFFVDRLFATTAKSLWEKGQAEA